jgi:predicted Zn-dependent protease
VSVERFAALVAQQPDNELFRFSLAQALIQAGQASAAAPHLQACAEKRIDWMMPRILLGKTLAQLGKPAEARPWLESALALAIAQQHEDPERELRALLAELS